MGKNSGDNLLPSVPAETLIPKIIHQTFQSADLPAELQQNVDEIRALNPDWEYRFYDDRAIERFILQHYGDRMLRIYLMINPAYGAARADLFRYLAVYRVGGIYLDIKSRFTGRIDQFVNSDDQFLISQWRNGPGEIHEGHGIHPGLEHVAGGEYQQWHVIAAPGSPFLRAVLENVCSNIASYRMPKHGSGRVSVLQLTGPIAYTLAIHPLLDTYPNRRVKNEADLGLEYSIRPGVQHRSLFSKHYSHNRSPIVHRGGPVGWFDTAYHLAREAKIYIHLLRNRRNSA